MSFRDYGLKGVVISMFIISITTYTKLHSDNNLYLLLSFICAVSVLVNFRTKSDFTDNTICFFFFMGFWFHPTYMILTGEIDTHGVNNYFNSDTLIISIFVFLSIITASLVFNYYNSNSVRNRINDEPLYNVFQHKQKLCFAYFIIIIMFICVINYKLSIYQRGIESAFKYNSLLINIFALLVGYGFLFFTAKLVSLVTINKQYLVFAIILLIFEQFLTNLSLLSRLMPVTVSALYYRHYIIYQDIQYSKKWHFMNVALIIFIGTLSPYISNTLRSNFYEPDKPSSIQSKSFNTAEFKSLNLITRFIGIEGVYYITQYQHFNNENNLFERMTKETRVPGQLSIYDRIILNKQANTVGVNAVTIPGFVGYLSSKYNHLWIYFILLLALVLIKLIEIIVTQITYGDKLCGAVIAYFLTYRLVHSGVYVADNYKLLIGLSVIIFAYTLINFILRYLKIG